MKSHLIRDSSDSSLVKSMKKVILEDLKVKYTGEILELLTKATLLDSRFKNLKFLVETDRKLAIDDLKINFYLVHGVKRSTPD